ncbi:MAG: hypothetical protein WCH07_08105 [Deltaproteobacteria bacterium]
MVCFETRTKTFLPFLLFGLLLTVVCLCHVSTVRTYPAPWGDEVHLLELGRCAVFERDTDWSIILSPRSSAAEIRPALFPTYLSGAVTELIYRTTGVFWAHRVFSILGLLVATLLCCRWLCKKGYSMWIAGCVALLFCTEIHITRSAHFYRPDMWVLAMTFFCALQVASMAFKSARSQDRQCAWVGLLMAFQLIYWFAAIFNWTLIIAEFLVLAQQEKWSRDDFFRRIGFFVVGVFAGLFVFLVIPFHDDIPRLAQQFLGHPDFVALQASSGATTRSPGVMWYATASITHLRVFALLLARAPFLWLLTAIGLVSCFCRNKVFAILFLSTGLVVIATNVYCFRMIYLLPFGVFFAAAGLDSSLKKCGKVRLFCNIVKVYSCLALLFGFGVSVVGLNLIAANKGAGQDMAWMVSKLESVIGKEAKRVYIFSWQPYFVGRELGWHLYSFLPKHPKYILQREAVQFLASMDYILVQERSDGLTEDNDRVPLTKAENLYLREEGFLPVAEVSMPSDDTSRLMGRLRRLIFAWEYPSFTVLKNQRNRSLK